MAGLATEAARATAGLESEATCLPGDFIDVALDARPFLAES